MNPTFIRTLVVAAILGTSACGGGDGGPVDPVVTPGILTGLVTADGAGVASAQVALTGRGTQTTDAAGRYTFSDVPVGSYTLSVTAPTGFTLVGSGSQSVTVASGQTQSVNFTAQRTTGGGGGGGGAQTVEVRLAGTSFTPSSVTIQRGSTVQWINVEGDHNVTPNTPSQAGTWPRTDLSGTQTFQHRFDTAGSFGYTCTLHAGMTGTVVVQ